MISTISTYQEFQMKNSGIISLNNHITKLTRILVSSFVIKRNGLVEIPWIEDSFVSDTIADMESNLGEVIFEDTGEIYEGFHSKITLFNLRGRVFFSIKVKKDDTNEKMKRVLLLESTRDFSKRKLKAGK